MPKDGLPTGTEIRNKASIVFDTNDPIVTPEWLNTLDNSKPASQVLALAPTQDASDFEVSWSGTDEGAGIKDYTIFVSEDGGVLQNGLSTLLTSRERSLDKTARATRFTALLWIKLEMLRIHRRVQMRPLQ